MPQLNIPQATRKVGDPGEPHKEQLQRKPIAAAAERVQLWRADRELRRTFHVEQQ